MLLTQYLEYHNIWMYFHQALSISALWDKDERFKFLGQKVKVQGHSGVQRAVNAPFSHVNTIS